MSVFTSLAPLAGETEIISAGCAQIEQVTRNKEQITSKINCAAIRQNPKFRALNTKQYLNLKFKYSKQCFKFWSFVL
jgi:hypothetical protein